MSNQISAVDQIWIQLNEELIRLLEELSASVNQILSEFSQVNLRYRNDMSNRNLIYKFMYKAQLFLTELRTEEDALSRNLQWIFSMVAHAC